MGEAEARAALLDVMRGRGKCPPELVALAVEAARQAQRMEPKSPQGDLLQARVRSMVAAHMLYHAQDPQLELQAAAEATHRAMDLDPGNRMALASRCTLLMRLGEYRLAHGMAAKDVLGEAIEVGGLARKKFPDDPFVVRDLAGAHRLMADA